MMFWDSRIHRKYSALSYERGVMRSMSAVGTAAAGTGARQAYSERRLGRRLPDQPARAATATATG
jgi:hypothetical protein